MRSNSPASWLPLTILAGLISLACPLVSYAGTTGQGFVINTSPSDANPPNACSSGNLGYSPLFDDFHPTPWVPPDYNTTNHPLFNVNTPITTSVSSYEGDNGGAIDYFYAWYKWSLSPQTQPLTPVHCRDDEDLTKIGRGYHQIESQGWTLIGSGLNNRCTTYRCSPTITGPATSIQASALDAPQPPGTQQVYYYNVFACKNVVCGCGGGSCGQCGCDQNWTGNAIYKFCTNSNCVQPTNNCQPSGGAQYRALVRAGRRGEVGAANGSNPSPFVATTGPDDGGSYPSGPWGPGYDSGDPLGSLGTIGYSTGSATVPTIHDSSKTGHYSRTGSPAANAYIQVADPTSDFYTPTGTLFPQSDPHCTAGVSISGIMGPNSTSGSVPANWPVAAMSAQNSIPTGSFASPNFPLVAAPIPATPLNYGVAGTPPFPNTPMGPPRPCTAGQPCDTDNATISTATYGYDDSKTPYLVLDAPPPMWGIVTGTVTEQSTNVPLPGVPVAVKDPGSPRTFQDFEKVTDENGVFRILIPSTGTVGISFEFNNPIPAGVNTHDTHYFDPHHAPDTTSFTNSLLAFVKPGDIIPFNNNAPVSLAPTLSSNLMTATISGTVKAVENQVVLSSITVELRDNSGFSVSVTTTDVNGQYVFPGLAGGNYFVVPILDHRQSALPHRLPVSVGMGVTVNGNNLQIRGVPATVVVNAAPSTYLPGTYVVLFSTWINLSGLNQPPSVNHVTTASSAFTMTNQGFYTGVIGTNSQATFNVFPGRKYSMVCWQLGTDYQYHQQVTQTNVGGIAFMPQTTSNVSCP